MNRRTFLALLSTPAVARLLQACGSDGSTSGTTTLPPTAEARSSLAREAVGPEQALRAAFSVNAFGDDLYRRLLATQPTANLVFSPASIGVALGMTAAGARGATLDEMLAVLHVTDPAAFHRSMNALTAALDTRTRTEPGPDGDEQTTRLTIANSLWGQRGLAFTPAFLDLLATEYGAGMHLVDYVADTEGARRAINAWVETATERRIPELLARGVLTAESRLTLVNAIYLKAQWETAFPEGATAGEPFTTAAGSTVTVPMMHVTDSFLYAEQPGWRAVEVPYVFGDLVLTVVMPDDPTGVVPLDEVTPLLTSRQVQLGMPRFDIETAMELGPLLTEMGMPTAFSDQANFGSMTEDVALQIAAVVHQANITTDEKGTEAAAATAVVMRPTSAPVDEPVTLTLDRPFTFALRDRPTGAVVFLGRVADPSQRR